MLQLLFIPPHKKVYKIIELTWCDDTRPPKAKSMVKDAGKQNLPLQIPFICFSNMKYISSSNFELYANYASRFSLFVLWNEGRNQLFQTTKI